MYISSTSRRIGSSNVGSTLPGAHRAWIQRRVSSSCRRQDSSGIVEHLRGNGSRYRQDDHSRGKEAISCAQQVLKGAM